MSSISIISFGLLWTAVSSCNTSRPDEFDDVVVQLKWIHQGQFAGFYIAEEKGFYDQEGIDATFHPGGIGVDIVDEVVSGRADFGVIGGEYIIISRNNDLPIKAIATTYQINPFVLVTMPGSGIDKPQDFIGKKVNVGGIDGFIQFQALLTKLDIDIEDIEITPYSYDLLAFYDREVDITPAFATGSLIEILKGIPDANVIWPIDYGVHLYSDTIFTTEQMLEENPDLVLRFLRATIEGHQYALDDPAVALESTMIYAQDADSDAQRDMIRASTPLIYTGKDNIGWMQEEVWQGMQEMLFEQKVITQTMEVDQLFTNKFLATIFEINQ